MESLIRIGIETMPIHNTGVWLSMAWFTSMNLFREYVEDTGTYLMTKEVKGIGLCPFSPTHNSTAVLGEKIPLLNGRALM
jgi:hypothetical protein